MSSILEALKKIEKEASGTDKKTDPVTLAQPIDIKETFSKGFRETSSYKKIAYITILVFFFSTTIVLLMMQLIPDRKKEKNPPPIHATTQNQKATPQAKTIIVEKNKTGVSTFEAIHP